MEVLTPRVFLRGYGVLRTDVPGGEDTGCGRQKVVGNFDGRELGRGARGVEGLEIGRGYWGGLACRTP